LQTRAVALAEGGAVIIVRVPRSYAPPHRVIYKNRSRFWARASSGKYEPNVEELRHIFTEAPRIAERVAAFRTDRIVRITAGETPVPFGPGGKVVLHLVPVPAFADGRLLDVVSAVAAGTHVPLPLDGMGAGNRPGINIDGFLNYADRPAGGRQRALLHELNVAARRFDPVRTQAAVATRHTRKASSRKTRSVRRDVRWRWKLKVFWTAA
jgi:hypothetical protein